MNPSEWISRIRQDARESWDYFISDEFVNIVDSPQVIMKSSPAIDYLNMWIQGKLWLEMLVRIKDVCDGQFCDYAIILERGFNYASIGEVSCYNPSFKQGHGEETVLINVGGLIQKPEVVTSVFSGIDHTSIPGSEEFGVTAVVRLKQLHDLNDLWFEVARQSRCQSISGLRVFNREVDVAATTTTIGSSSSGLKSQIIQGRPEVRENVS